MKTILKEEQCLVCKGTGQRGWLYRHVDDAAFGIASYVMYVMFWDTIDKGFKVLIIVSGFAAIISFIYEKEKNKRGKCKNCEGTGRITLEELIEDI